MGGGSCAVCTSTQSCVASSCQTNPSDGGNGPDSGNGHDAGGTNDAGGTTDAGRGTDAGHGSDAGADAGPTCAGCYQSGQCIEPWFENNTECGINGAECTDCQTSASVCGVGSGQCGSMGIKFLGSSCTADSQCAVGNDTGATWCLNSWTDGYCTDACETNGGSSKNCSLDGSPTYCLGVFGQITSGNYAGLCLFHCVTNLDCDTGKSCDTTIGDGQGYCVPICTTQLDCDTYFPGAGTQCQSTSNGSQCCGGRNFACCGPSCAAGLTCTAGTCT
jgi:hypothetical protein